MKHLGDITKIDGHNVPLVDVVCGGSPCQDLSVAGKRAGLAGQRSGLFMDQIRVIKEMRDESRKRLCGGGADVDFRLLQPRFMVWENVPGAFSSNGGEDFRAVLEETARVADENTVIPKPSGKWTPSGAILGDGWSIAWRVHDAQFWGVPQRRKRIALVADFGGQSAPEILFERKGVSGDFEESEEQRESPSPGIGSGSDSAIRLQGNGIDRADAAGCNGRGWRVWGSYTLNTIDRPAVVSFQERAGKPGGGKGILIQNERTGALSTLNNQSVFTIGHDERSARFTTDEKTDPLTASDWKDPVKIIQCSGGGEEITGTLLARGYKGTTDEDKLIIQKNNGFGKPPTGQPHKGKG